MRGEGVLPLGLPEGFGGGKGIEGSAEFGNDDWFDEAPSDFKGEAALDGDLAGVLFQEDVMARA